MKNMTYTATLYVNNTFIGESEYYITHSVEITDDETNLMLRMCDGLNSMVGWNLQNNHFVSVFDKDGAVVLLNPNTITKMYPSLTDVKIEDISAISK